MERDQIDDKNVTSPSWDLLKRIL